MTDWSQPCSWFAEAAAHEAAGSSERADVCERMGLGGVDGQREYYGLRLHCPCGDPVEGPRCTFERPCPYGEGMPAESWDG